MMALTPDPVRAARVRARCRMQLARSRPPASGAAGTTGSAWRVLVTVVGGAVCILYIAALMATTLRLEGLIQ
jgi:hypothetical protein